MSTSKYCQFRPCIKITLHSKCHLNLLFWTKTNKFLFIIIRCSALRWQLVISAILSSWTTCSRSSNVKTRIRISADSSVESKSPMPISGSRFTRLDRRTSSGEELGSKIPISFSVVPSTPAETRRCLKIRNLKATNFPGKQQYQKPKWITFLSSIVCDAIRCISRDCKTASKTSSKSLIILLKFIVVIVIYWNFSDAISKSWHYMRCITLYCIGLHAVITFSIAMLKINIILFAKDKNEYHVDNF